MVKFQEPMDKEHEEVNEVHLLSTFSENKTRFTKRMIERAERAKKSYGSLSIQV